MAKRSVEGARTISVATPDDLDKLLEWLGGIVSLAAYVTGEGEPYRPETLIWMGPDGAILGTEMAPPGELLGLAAERAEIDRAERDVLVAAVAWQLARTVWLLYPAGEAPPPKSR